MGLIRSILLGDEDESLPKPVVGLIGFVMVLAFALELSVGFGSSSLANVELLRSIGREDPEVARQDLGRALALLPHRYSSPGTAALLAGVIAGLCLGLSPRRIAAVYGSTIFKLRVPLLTISLMLALGYVSRYSGTDTTEA